MAESALYEELMNGARGGAIFLQLANCFDVEEMEKMAPEAREKLEAEIALTDVKIQELSDKIRSNNPSIDFGKNSTAKDISYACDSLVEKCEADPASVQFCLLENLVEDGMSDHGEAVNNLLANRIMPNGQRIPDNAVFVCPFRDQAFAENPEVANNMMTNSRELATFFGDSVYIENPTKADRETMVSAFNDIAKGKAMSINPETTKEQ